MRLICVGTGLTFLRWSFNSDAIIVTFTPDDLLGTVTTTLTNPAFISVELTKVVQSSNEIFGNFSSTLTVDLSEVVRQTVTSIKCGDPVTFDAENINLDIVEEAIPEAPVFSGLQAIQHEMGSRGVKVSWKQVVKLIIHSNVVTGVVSLLT